MSNVSYKSLSKKASVCICLVLLMVFLVSGVVHAETATGQNLPRLVDVGADKCIPCIAMAPILEELKKEYAGALSVEFVDVWKKPEEAQKYRVRGIPTQIFYDPSGKELGRHLGFISKEQILKTFKELGISVTKPQKK